MLQWSNLSNPKMLLNNLRRHLRLKKLFCAEATTEQKEAEPKVINFKDVIPEKYKDEKAIEFTSMDDFVKSYLSAQRLVGANKVAIPNKMATDEDWEEVYSKLGRPAKPEDYKYSFSEEEINQDQLKILTRLRIELDYFLSKQNVSLNFIMK